MQWKFNMYEYKIKKKKTLAGGGSDPESVIKRFGVWLLCRTPAILVFWCTIILLPYLGSFKLAFILVFWCTIIFCHILVHLSLRWFLCDAAYIYSNHIQIMKRKKYTVQYCFVFADAHPLQWVWDPNTRDSRGITARSQSYSSYRL